MFFRMKRAKSLGKAQGPRRYDLPLDHKSAGAGFLLLLIGLMTFLAVLALAASFALSAMTARWSAGLENRVTVEIPAESSSGQLRSREEMNILSTRAADALRAHPAVKGAHVLSEREIADLVRPWLGDDAPIKDLPVPGLIALELEKADAGIYDSLRAAVAGAAPGARLDTHESWMNDLLRFTGALQFAAGLLAIVIAVTTAAAVAGAVRARMAVHHEQVELLHLMGARDRYIARQFQRHAMILALQGGIGGMLAGALALRVIGWTAGEMDVNLLPDFRLGAWQVVTLLVLPAFAAAIAAATAGRTVHNVLMKMP